MSITRRGGRNTGLPSHVLRSQRCLLPGRGDGELAVDHADKCLVVGNARGGEDGTVKGVVTFAEGHDGRAAGASGIVRASHGRLGSISGCVDLIRKGNLGIRRRFSSLNTRQLLRLLHVPLLKRTLRHQKRCHIRSILPRRGKSHGGTPSSRARKDQRSLIFQTTQNDCGGEVATGFECEVSVGNGGTCLAGTLLGGTGVGVGEGDGAHQGGIFGDDGKAGGESGRGEDAAFFSGGRGCGDSWEFFRCCQH
mmetsp:Transcript_19129/g.30920  ORF Transcript_19129/g.30920 Transcript_19129/m.30920 type:complete len:251 (+) Transcript_19129:780-1532(+)